MGHPCVLSVGALSPRRVLPRRSWRAPWPIARAGPGATRGENLPVRRILTGVAIPDSETKASPQMTPEDDQSDNEPADSLRIGDLPSATAGVAIVKPEDTIASAQTLMMVCDYSQLAVQHSDRGLARAITWESVAKAVLHHGATQVKEALISPPIVPQSDDLLGVIPRIVESAFVLVSGLRGVLTGIVTTADLSQQFADMAGPFLLLSEIERRLRGAIGTHFTVEEMAAVRRSTESRLVTSVHDLTLSDVAVLIGRPEHWERLQWPLDRAVFLDALDHVRRIRNQVMHFRPEALEARDNQALLAFRKCLRTVRTGSLPTNP